MTSSVFYRFKSQKEPQRITFDGTGITVFELKRDIITTAGLGDGSDFDLSIYSEDSNKEYDDDTTIIPRSTSVVARRLPAVRPGHGKAARYVTGKMPVQAKNQYRTESGPSRTSTQTNGTSAVDAAAKMANAQTEEEKIAAMFEAEGWEQQQEKMKTMKAYYNKPNYKGRPVNIPDHEPPAGYVCHRCHEKGHWIQVCPTNDDPNFQKKPNITRTTGIPKSMLKKVGKPVAAADDGLTDDRPASYMMNAEGEFVEAVPDSAAWERHVAKTKVSAAQEEAATLGSKDLQDRGLECPIDKRLFIQPMKTPCCGKTYCNDCIENALVNSDLVCPSCSKEGVLIDDLVEDVEMNAKVKVYEEEKAAERKAKEQSKSPKSQNAAPVKEESKDANGKTTSPSPSRSRTMTPSGKPATPNGTSKKRPAEEELKSDRIPTGPAAMRKPQLQPLAPPKDSVAAFAEQMNNLATQQLGGATSQFPSMSGMGYQNQFPGMMGMQMSMAPLMAMPQAMMNPMMGRNPMMYGGQGWNMGNAMMNGMSYPSQQNGMYPYQQFNSGYSQHNGYPHQNWTGNQSQGQGWNNGVQSQHQQGQIPQFENQQRTTFSEPFPNEEDSPYQRKPVNPHRSNRQKRMRPSDYTELH